MLNYRLRSHRIPSLQTGSSHVAALAFPDNQCLISTNILSRASRWATPHPTTHHHPASLWVITRSWPACPNQAETNPKFLATVAREPSRRPSEPLSRSRKMPGAPASGRRPPRGLGPGPRPCSPRGAGRRPRRSHCPRSPRPSAFRPSLSVAHTRGASGAPEAGRQQLRRRRGGGGAAARGGAGGRRGGGPGRGGRGASERAASAASSREEREQQHGGAPTPAARLLPPHRRGREPPAGRLPRSPALRPPGRGSGTRSAWRRSAGSPLHPAPPLSFGGTAEICKRARGGTGKGEGERLQFRAGALRSPRRPLPRPRPSESRAVAGLGDRGADR